MTTRRRLGASSLCSIAAFWLAAQGAAEVVELGPCVAGTERPAPEESLLDFKIDPIVLLKQEVTQRFNLSYPHRQSELLIFPKSSDLVSEEKSAAWTSLLDRVGATVVREDRSVPMIRIRLPASAVLQDIADQLMTLDSDRIGSIEANSCVFPQQVGQTSDPESGSQWGHWRIGLEDAWRATTGSQSVVVAVIDSGMNHAHADLSCNFWGNSCQAFDSTNDACQGLLDDGRVGDVNGWNFVDEDDQLRDAAGHGTMVAGIIGACQNDQGIVGTNWDVSLMDLRAYDTIGASGSIDYVISALKYAISNGAHVVNLSLLTGNSAELYRLIQSAPDVIVTTVAGDDLSGTGQQLGASRAAHPCSWTPNLPNLICVTSSTQSGGDEKAQSANYGDVVQIAAPGVDIASTLGTATGTKSGTSLAAPYVAGVVALLKSRAPLATTKQIVDCALSGDDVPALAGMTAPGPTPNTGRRLSAAKAMECISPYAQSGSAPGPGSAPSPPTLLGESEMPR